MKIKKILLSVFAIVAFGAYAAYRYFGGQGGNVYVAPPTPFPSSPVTSSNPPSETPTPISGYKDGSYTGNVADAYFGNLQVKTIIQNGKIVDVQFLQYPNDRATSIKINTSAMPVLKSEAITAQSSKVDIVSGATQTSQAFIESLAAALAQAK